jgi:hypothetical protein
MHDHNDKTPKDDNTTRRSNAQQPDQKTGRAPTDTQDDGDQQKSVDSTPRGTTEDPDLTL